MNDFWSRVRKGDGCWEWTGPRLRHGYGKHRRKLAHRLAWELHNGPVPPGMFVCHRCDNPPCVRPEHLFIGTASDNTQDMLRKGRFRWIHGEQMGSAVLNDAKVIEIIKALRAGAKQQDLATKYGVSRQPIWLIAHNKGWKHIPRLP